MASTLRQNRFWWRYVSNTKRTWRSWQAPRCYTDSIRIGQEIAEQGIVVGPSDRFLSTEGGKLLTEARELVLGISRSDEVQAIVARGMSDDTLNYVIPLVRFENEHSADSPLVRLALDKKLLEIVSCYLGLWPRLYRISAWLNFPTAGKAQKSQLWHRDRHDLKIVKVFIYLVDVDENCGPFTYIPATHRHQAQAELGLKQDDKNITDEEMSLKLPAHSWQICTGPPYTMILADTMGYHRGGKPTKGNRILITFTYTSGTPFKDGRFRVTGQPAWNMDGIQSEALRLILLTSSVAPIA
jgi:hypothetical protein